MLLFWLNLAKSDNSLLHISYSTENSAIIAITLLRYCEITHRLKAVTSGDLLS